MAVRKNAKPVEGARFADKMNPFWLEPHARDVMGYKLTGIDEGELIAQGTPLYCDDATKTAEVCNHCYVDAVATDKKTLTVKPGHRVKAGAKYAVSGALGTVLTVASANEDTVVLSAQSAVKAGDILVEVTAADTVKKVPNRVAAARSDEDGTISATHAVIILQNVVHYPAEYMNLTAFPGDKLLAGCSTIRFTIQ